MSGKRLFAAPQSDIAHRQSQLAIGLHPAAAATPATLQLAHHDAELLAAVAGVDRYSLITDPSVLQTHTGTATPETIWGWSDRARSPALIFVDIARCGRRDVVRGVLAHEITHLTHHGPAFDGHSDRWWHAVQSLLGRTPA